MQKFRFFDFKVYKDAKQFHREIVFITNKFPKEYYYLIDQLRRCTLSVILNIAEGSGKNSDRDFNRYIKNSLGSINEAASCLDVALDIGLVTEDIFRELIDEAAIIKNELGAFSNKLKAGS